MFIVLSIFFISIHEKSFFHFFSIINWLRLLITSEISKFPLMEPFLDNGHWNKIKMLAICPLIREWRTEELFLSFLLYIQETIIIRTSWRKSQQLSSLFWKRFIFRIIRSNPSKLYQDSTYLFLLCYIYVTMTLYRR